MANRKTRRGVHPCRQADICLVSMIGHADQDILPHMLSFYREMGIRHFTFALPGDFSRESVEYLDNQVDVSARAVPNELFTEPFKRRVLSKLVEPLLGQWIVVCDADEFLELPGSSIHEVIGWMESMGMDALPAFLVQRISSDGSLTALHQEDNPEDVYQLYDLNLCERLVFELPGSRPTPPWKTKFPLARVTERFDPLMGQHWPQNGASHAHLPLRGTVSHFKWRQSLRESMSLARGADAGLHEPDVYQSHLFSSGWRLPTVGARLYSRMEMIERGFLVIPDNKQLTVGQTLHRVLSNRSETYSSADRVALRSVQRKFSCGDGGADEVTDLTNLLTEPGKIGFVTFALGGPGQMDGIATATSSLLERLVTLGHAVEVIYCPFKPRHAMTPTWQAYWEARGVTVTFMPRYRDNARYPSHEEFSREIAERLRTRDFDVIHFDDVAGYGSVIGQLRAAGIAYQNTALVTTTHGCGRWHMIGNREPWTVDAAAQDFGVTRQLRFSDLVIHPSRHMKSWLDKNKQIIGKQIVVPNALPGLSRSFKGGSHSLRTISEVVYFGRIERRKGLQVFLEALSILKSWGSEPPKISLLGGLGNDVTEQALAEEFQRFGVKPNILNDFDGMEAVNYLRANDCLAVIPSLIDNLPYTVYECLENGIPMVCSDVGGIPEMVDQNDQDRIMIAGDPDKLASFIDISMKEGVRPARLAFDPEAAALRQLATFSWLVERGRAGQPSSKLGPASAVIYNDPGIGMCDALSRALEKWWSAGLVDEVVEVGTNARSCRRVVSDINSQVKMARNEHILLCHGALLPTEDRLLDAMMRLMEAGRLDAVTCDFRTELAATMGANAENLGEPIFAPGGPLEYSPSLNVYGVGPALVRRPSFISAGGLCSDCNASRWVIWEVLNALAASEFSIGSLPEAMVTLPLGHADELDYVGNKFLLERLTTPWLADVTVGQESLIRKSVQSDFGSYPHPRYRPTPTSAILAPKPFEQRNGKATPTKEKERYFPLQKIQKRLNKLNTLRRQVRRRPLSLSKPSDATRG